MLKIPKQESMTDLYAEGKMTDLGTLEGQGVLLLPSMRQGKSSAPVARSSFSTAREKCSISTPSFRRDLGGRP